MSNSNFTQYLENLEEQKLELEKQLAAYSLRIQEEKSKLSEELSNLPKKVQVTPDMVSSIDLNLPEISLSEPTFEEITLALKKIFKI